MNYENKGQLTNFLVVMKVYYRFCGQQEINKNTVKILIFSINITKILIHKEIRPKFKRVMTFFDVLNFR